MRSLSNIIKGGNIREQGIIDLSNRIPQQVERIYLNGETTHEMVLEEVISYETEAEIAAESEEEKQAEMIALEQEALEKVRLAKEEAEAIIADALAKAQEIENQSKQQAKELLAQATAQQESIMKACEDEVEQIRNSALQEKDELLGLVEGEVVETLITIMQHIISEELHYPATWLKYIVRKMLHGKALGENIVLCISPNLHTQLESQQEDLLTCCKQITSIKEDETLTDTSCKLIIDEGTIEYDVLEGLEKVVAQLRILKGLAQE